MAGIYIHIPFCRQACYYCNFHFSTNSALQNDFKNALLKEAEIRREYLEDERVETIYFGGGTPSLLPTADIHEMMKVLSGNFNIEPGAEVTLEANPDDMDPRRMDDWRESGVNRLSIGIQSFFDEDLAWMNRVHKGGQAIDAVIKAKEAGFINFSVDLIYGSPGLSDGKWEKNIQTAISLDPPHLSCYALTIEPKTVLYKQIRTKQVEDIQPEKQAAQFLAGIQFLQANGYEHYEISSFAKPGMRSRHNSSYWQSKKYLGLGPSAHSFNGRSRQWNIANNLTYIKSVAAGMPNFEYELLQPRDLLNEYIMTSLRTNEGLDLRHVSNQFGKDKEKKLESNASVYIRDSKMEMKNERLVLTTSGKLFADGIAAALFFD